MGGVRKTFVAVVVAVASLGSAGVVAVVGATPSGAASCTDNWQGPTTGTTAWNANALNWSSGFPGSSSVVCIAGATSFTVDLTASATISSLQLGGTAGTQTLKVDGAAGSTGLTVGSGSTSNVAAHGALVLAATPSGFAAVEGGSTAQVDNAGAVSTSAPAGSNPAYIETALTNQSGGTVTIGAPDSRQDDSTTTVNDGSFTVASAATFAVSGGSSFTDASGATLTVTGTMSENSGSFTQSGATESGNPVVITGATVADSAGTGAFDVKASSTLTGTIPAGQTVTVDGSTQSVNLALPSAVSDAGTLALDPSPSGYAQLNGAGGLTVKLGGAVTTSAPAGSNPAYIETALTNQSGGTVTIGAPDSRQDNNTTTVNDGSFTVDSGATFAVSGGSSFTDASGATLTVTGTMSENGGTFTQSGATESGNPVLISSATVADSAGTGAFDVKASSTLTGTIPAGQTVTVDGSTQSVNLALPSAVSDAGTLALDPSPSGYAQLNGAGGLTVKLGGAVTTSSPTGSNPAYIETAVTNKLGGTVTIGAPDSRQDNNTTTVNDGSFTVDSGATFAVSGGSSFTDASGATLTVTGTMSENGGTFTQSGATESGNPVLISSATVADSAGTGAFDVKASSTLTGTIPAGQTVTVDGATQSVDLALPSAVTDAGTLALDPSPSGYADINGAGGLTVTSGGALTTSSPTGSNPAYFETKVTNQAGGTVTIGAPDSRMDINTASTSAGVFDVLNGGHLALSGAATLSNTGTLGVTVNGTAGTGGISGPGVTITGSELSVTTVGSPSSGTMFTPVAGPVTGTFSTFTFGPDAYTVAYPSGAVQLTVVNPYTVTPTPFTPKSYIQTGAIQVASIGSANLGTGAYSATIDWGDGKPVQAATVAITGPTGTVTAPTHKYKVAGSYPVTVTVANTDGTTIVTTQSVTVTGPTVTSFTPSGAVGSTVTIKGTSLGGATAVIIGGKSATITSDSATKILVKVPSGAASGDKIKVETPPGNTKTATTFTVT